MTLAQQLAQGVLQLGFTLPAGAQQRLLEYLALLQKWNRVYNLTAVREAPRMVSQHLLDSLAAAPTRGSQPKELRALGDQEYRQVFFKPCRLIYRVIGQRVAIYLIAHGRRDMQSLLARRLLGGS